ncbi:MAG: hypothetical protein EOP45_12530 [Sphingobacteriaceae bacterium]|nr:MAG: hypothetical protein EOP45_12530 [Sphingobacteriaceae bacterium]
MIEKSDYYSEFKPIRNKIKKLSLLHSIRELHLLLNRKPIKEVPEIVEFLYVNLIIYAEGNPAIRDEKLLFNDVINNCNTLRDTITSTSIDSDVWQWVHSMALNQLKGKHNNYLDVVYRYYFIFSEERISNHIEKVLGLPYKSYLICGKPFIINMSSSYLLVALSFVFNVCSGTDSH